MAEEKLTNEELEQAAGGKAFARASRGDLQGGGTVVPSAGQPQDDDNDGPTPSIGDVDGMDDPAHQ